MEYYLNLLIIFLCLTLFVVYKRTKSYVSLNGLVMLLFFVILVFLKLTTVPDLRILGFRVDNFGDTLIPLIVYNAIGTAILFSMGYGGKRFKVFGWFISLVTLYFAFGVVQQIFFQSIITDTRSKVVGDHNLTILFSSIIYASFHWGWGIKKITFGFLTLIAGIVWSTLYLKSPNIYLLGLSHAILASIYYFRVRVDNILQSRLSLSEGRGLLKHIYH
jgi:hypothetical protein